MRRPASAAFMTAEEEAEAVRRSQRQRRPPAHLSSDDDALASDASDEDKRAARSAGARPHPFAQHPVERHDAPGSDDSDQSCYGAPRPCSQPLSSLADCTVLRLPQKPLTTACHAYQFIQQKVMVYFSALSEYPICAEDEDMDIIDLDEPEGHEHVKARYSHAAWSSPSDDSFFAEVSSPLHP